MEGQLEQLNALLMFNIALLLVAFGLFRAFLGLYTLARLERLRKKREAQLLRRTRVEIEA